MCVLSIKVPVRKKPGNLFNDPCICFSIKPFVFHVSSFGQHHNTKVDNKIINHHGTWITYKRQFCYISNFVTFLFVSFINASFQLKTFFATFQYEFSKYTYQQPPRSWSVWAAGWWLMVLSPSTHYLKGTRKIVLERKKESMRSVWIGQLVAESLGGGIDLQKEIYLWLLHNHQWTV